MDTLTPQELAFNEWWAENFKDLAYQGVGKTVARIGWNAAWQKATTQSLKAALESNELREELSAIAHDAWCGWMKYMFSKTIEVGDQCEEIPASLVARWKRQMDTSYADLPENERASDRVEADKYLNALRVALEAK